MSRWVRVHTSIFDHGVFSDEPFSEREAWLWLISMAAWKDTRHRVGKTVVTVPAGSLFVTLRELQGVWKWGSDYRVRTFLKLLQDEEMIALDSSAGKTQVSICNYMRYQNPERTENASETHGKRTENALKTPIHQNTNNTSSLRSEERADAPKTRGSRLPDDFEPDLDFAVSQGLSRSQAEREAASFRDYWPAQPGQRGVKTDWPATWRNWVRKAAERLAPQARGSPPQHTPSQADVFHFMGERFEANGQAEKDSYGARAPVSYLPAARSG